MSDHNNTTGDCTFHLFYDTWFNQLHRLTAQLSQITDHHNSATDLIDAVMAHYSEYYRVKSLATDSDVLSLFASPWATSVERSLHWITGFRPTTVFHLIYTESSAKFGSHLLEILHGRRTGDLGELTPSQLARVSDLQCEAVKKENEISGRLAEWQEELAGVEWAAVCCSGGAAAEEVLEGTVGRLKEVVDAADKLRMETMKKVVEMLTPQQQAEFLVAAAELLFGVRSWGLHQDRLRGGFA